MDQRLTDELVLGADPRSIRIARGFLVSIARQLDLPPVALTLPPGSDLVLVETTHAAPAPEPEAFDAQRPRRVRPPRVVAPSEPLEIVETRKDGPTATH